MEQGAKVDLSRLSDEDLQIYEDLLKQKQGGSASAAPEKSYPAAGPGGIETFVDQAKHFASSAADAVMSPVHTAVDLVQATYAPGQTRLDALKRIVGTVKGVGSQALDQMRDGPIISAAKLVAPALTPAAKIATGKPISDQEMHTAAEVGGNITGNLAMAAAPEIGGKIGKATSPERIRALAEKIKTIGESTNPGLKKVVTAAGASVGGAIGYKIAPGPTAAVAGGAAGGYIADSVFKGAANLTAKTASLVAAAREAMGAPHFDSPTMESSYQRMQNNEIGTSGYQPEQPTPIVDNSSGFNSEASKQAIEQNRIKAIEEIRSQPTRADEFRPANAGYASAQGRINTPPAYAPEDVYPPDPSYQPQPQTPPEPNWLDAQGNDIRSQAVPPAGVLDTPIKPVAPEIVMAREALLAEGAPLTHENIMAATQNAESLLEVVPELKGLKPGSQFNRRLYNAFDIIGHDLNAAEGSIPRETTIATKAYAGEIGKIADDAALFGETPATRAASKLKTLFDEGTITWEEFIKEKRAFFKEVPLTSKTGAAVYDVLKQISDEVSPELGDLNHKWFVTKKSIDLAKTSAYTGEKSIEVARQIRANQKARKK